MRAALFAFSTLAVATAAVAAPPVSVTRFAAPGEIVRGPAASVTAAASLEQKSYEDIVGRELARVGFVGEGAPRYSYSVEVTQNTRVNPVRRSPVTIGVGVGSGGWGGGFGIGGSFGVGTPRGRDTFVTRLAVQLRDKDSGKVVWEGRAEGEATNARDASVDRLAAALFRDFPGESGRTISVR